MFKSPICILVLLSVTVLFANGQSRGESGQFRPPLPQSPFPQQYYQQPGGQSAINQQFVRPQQQSQFNSQIYGQNNKQTNLHNRFSADDANSYSSNDEITTRPPKQGNRNPSIPQQPPPSFTTNTRFGPENVNRKLVWDEILAEKTEQFSLLLFAILANNEFSNFMISPRSIHNLLVLIAEGAGGNTYAELDRTVGLISKQRTRDFHQYNNLALNKSSADVIIRTFSALIGDKNRPIDREYDDIVEKVYEADYIPVNFQDIEGTLREVNEKISKETNGQIRQAIAREDLLKAQLILLSGINFQGRWKNVFNTSFTKQEPFKDANDNRVIGHVNMMFQRGNFPFAAIRDLGSYLIELPYGTTEDPTRSNDDRISMILVLPRKGLSLFDAINLIYKYGFKRVLVELKKAKEEYDDDEVEVHIPRFEVDTSINLVPTLQDMGIKDLFEQNRADLGGINSNYFISSVLHKTKIRVDEKGTEASGVTTSIFANKATPPKFHANRPFLYFIVDKSTRLILFSGAYQTPSLF